LNQANSKASLDIFLGERMMVLRKLNSLIMFVFVLCLIGSVSAFDIWQGGGGPLWTDGANWSLGYCPQHAGESASIRAAGSSTIDSTGYPGGPLLANSLRGEYTGTFTLTMTADAEDLQITNEFWMRAGSDIGDFYLDMLGGTLTVGGQLRVGGGGAGSSVYVQLDGGTINCNTLDVRTSGSIDITGSGTLIIDGDVRTQIQGYVDSDLITGYSGSANVLVGYSSGTNKTTVTTDSASIAYLPDPFDTETQVSSNVTLSWQPVAYADSHDVYFGTDRDDVDNAGTSSDEFVRNQVSTSIARVDYYPSGPLDAGMTYYWRIDEVSGSTHVKGNVWSFTTDTTVAAGFSVQNPVIYKLADSGAMKFNGEYYTIGTGSSGFMYSSENLINWGPPEHAFSMDNDWATGEAGEDNEIHACDMKYADGVFHLYWSVNRADIGVRHIGHATNTTNPMGPYTEPVTSTWFADYIDAHLFIDDDGSPYFYTVKFPDGNVCYGQAMTDPWTRTGYDYWLIDAANGTWETYDGTRINEGPEVLKYRDKYYMLYAANATGAPSYSVGCVESNSPLSFNGSGKYPYPVLEQETRGGHSVTHTGQPCLLRGPNGFEWWVIYFASYDGSIKSQSVDRVLFFDRELYITGPSSNLVAFIASTYTPPPAPPTLGDLFNEGSSLASHWDIKAGSWDISDKQARQTLTSGSDNKAIIKSAAARNYLVEAGVKLTDPYPTGEKAGLVAYYKDTNNWMVVALDQQNGSWYYNKVEAGVPTVTGFSLPPSFDFNVYHNIRVTKNDTDFYVWIDERPAPGSPAISTGFSDEGLPGLYSQQARAYYDGFIYTIGWDEYDDEITGWGSADAGATPTGTWSTGSNGIEATNASTTNRTYKGDMLEQYEFMTQVTRTSTVPTDADPHTMGIYAIYTDTDNWMIACIDLVNDRLKVYGLQNGVSIGDRLVSVDPASSYNLRVIKRDDATRIFVDGQLKVTVLLDWGPSQVGLRAENIQARYNGITLFGLNAQYGDNSSTSEAMADNFDDSIISSKWQQVSIHADDVTKHDHDTLPDIVVHETNARLQFSGCEMGDDSTAWYGRGLKYIESVYGNGIAEFDFDSLLAHSNGGVERAAIGLRFWKDEDNWFEVRQKDDQDGDRLQTVEVNNGSKSTSEAMSSATSGSLKVKFNNSSGVLQYFLNGSSQGIVSMSGMMNSEYYVYITAYTSNTSNRIACNVDNFKIITNKANFDNDWSVNLVDFANFADYWLDSNCDDGNQWCQRRDFDKSGEVDVDDLAEFVGNWLWSAP